MNTSLINILYKLYTFSFYFIVGLRANQRLYYHNLFWDKAALVATSTSQADAKLNSGAPSRSLCNRSCACQRSLRPIASVPASLPGAEPFEKLNVTGFRPNVARVTYMLFGIRMSHYIEIPISRIRLQIGTGIYTAPTADTVTRDDQPGYLSSARPMVHKDGVSPT